MKVNPKEKIMIEVKIGGDNGNDPMDSNVNPKWWRMKYWQSHRPTFLPLSILIKKKDVNHKNDRGDDWESKAVNGEKCNIVTKSWESKGKLAR